MPEPADVPRIDAAGVANPRLGVVRPRGCASSRGDTNAGVREPHRSARVAPRAGRRLPAPRLRRASGLPSTRAPGRERPAHVRGMPLAVPLSSPATSRRDKSRSGGSWGTSANCTCAHGPLPRRWPADSFSFPVSTFPRPRASRPRLRIQSGRSAQSERGPAAPGGGGACSNASWWESRRLRRPSSWPAGRFSSARSSVPRSTSSSHSGVRTPPGRRVRAASTARGDDRIDRRGLFGQDRRPRAAGRPGRGDPAGGGGGRRRPDRGGQQGDARRPAHPGERSQLDRPQGAVLRPDRPHDVITAPRGDCGLG